jgi:hypothetical protein
MLIVSPRFKLITAAATVWGVYTPGFAGYVRGLAVRPVVAATPGDASARNVTARINGTPLTGGVVAASGDNMDVVDEVQPGSVITAGGTFNADDQIDFSIAVEGVTPFTAGEIEVILLVDVR